MDIVNCRMFRLSAYREHKTTGEPPKREFRYTAYRSGDNGGKQSNHAIKVWLTTWHLKLRYNAPHKPRSEAESA